MPTLKQKRAFKEVGVNGGNISKAMKVAGYSPSASKRTDKLTRTKGWEQLMKQELPDGLLAKRHRALLNKNETIIVHEGKESRVEITTQPHSDVKGALDMAYKLKAKYAPEKHQVEIQEITAEEKEQVNKALEDL